MHDHRHEHTGTHGGIAHVARRSHSGALGAMEATRVRKLRARAGEQHKRRHVCVRRLASAYNNKNLTAYYRVLVRTVLEP